MAGSWHEPRRLVFHALTVLAVVVCVLAAVWQWDRAHRTEEDAVPVAPAVGLGDLDPTTAYSGMRVALVGTFDAQHELLVAPRSREGSDGAWVLTPLLPDPANGAGGAAVGVVRGWIPAGTLPPAPPAGTVHLEAVLVADARKPGVAPTGDPPTIETVDTGVLAAVAGYPIRSGWFAQLPTQPAADGQPLPLQVTELPGADVGLDWRNAAYAVQWIAFAGFVVFFWNRFRRDLDVRSAQGSMR